MSSKDEQTSVRKAEAEVHAARAELVTTIDQLVTRVDPRPRIHEASRATKQAVRDTGDLLTGKGLPNGEPDRTRNVKIVVGSLAGLIAITALLVLRKK